jgi:hypothetical protein
VLENNVMDLVLSYKVGTSSGIINIIGGFSSMDVNYLITRHVTALPSDD